MRTIIVTVSLLVLFYFMILYTRRNAEFQYTSINEITELPIYGKYFSGTDLKEISYARRFDSNIIYLKSYGTYLDFINLEKHFNQLDSIIIYSDFNRMFNYSPEGFSPSAEKVAVLKMQSKIKGCYPVFYFNPNKTQEIENNTQGTIFIHFR